MSEIEGTSQAGPGGRDLQEHGGAQRILLCCEVPDLLPTPGNGIWILLLPMVMAADNPSPGADGLGPGGWPAAVGGKG